MNNYLRVEQWDSNLSQTHIDIGRILDMSDDVNEDIDGGWR